MRINHNISALKINTILNKNNNALEKSLQRLSSGYKINCAADDAAGLAISEKMKTQIAGLNQASRNASDGISVIQTAEGALIEVEQMLQRMRELAVEAANGSYTDEDRATLQDEVKQLKEEINRISTTTEFNTKTLLDGTVDRRSYSDNNHVKLISLSDSVNVKSYNFEVTRDAEQAIVMTTLHNSTAPAGGIITINNEEVRIAEDDSLDDILSKLTSTCDCMGIYVGYTDGTNDPAGPGGYKTVSPQNAVIGNTKLLFVTNDYGSDASLSVSCNNATLANALGLSGTANASGTDARVKLGTDAAKGAMATCTGIVGSEDCGSGNITYTINNGETGLSETVKYTVTAGQVQMEYTDYTGRTITQTKAIATNKNRDVIDAMRQLAAETPGSDALSFTIKDDGTYISFTAASLSSGKNISMDVLDDNTGLCANSAAKVEGRDRDRSDNGALGTMSTTFINVDGEKISLEFTITPGQVKMTYMEGDVVVRTQTSSSLPIPANNGQVMDVIEELYATLASPTIGMTTETVGGDEHLVFTALDEAYSKVTVYDSTGYLSENSVVSYTVSDTTATNMTGPLTFKITSADGSYSDTVSYDVSDWQTDELPVKFTGFLTGSGSYNGVPYEDIFSLTLTGNTIEISSAVPGLNLTIDDPAHILHTPLSADRIEGDNPSGNGTVSYTFVPGAEVDMEVSDSLLTLTYTHGTDTITRTQTLSHGHTNKEVLTAVAELWNSDFAPTEFNLDMSDPHNASFTIGSPSSASVQTTLTENFDFYNSKFEINSVPEGITQGRSVETKDGRDAGGFTSTATMSVNGDFITVRDRDGFEMVLQAAGGSVGTDTTVTVLDAGPMTLQIGASEGQTMEVRIPCINTTTLFLDDTDISTQDGAEHAITSFNNAVLEISSVRAKLGAYQNRLEHAINSLDTSAENLTEALSRIQDTDMASEMATYTQLQVLVQAATTMLSQANERPQNILNLLQS